SLPFLHTAAANLLRRPNFPLQCRQPSRSSFSPNLVWETNLPYSGRPFATDSPACWCDFSFGPLGLLFTTYQELAPY
ncbi:MAG: hypothetical protein WAV08_00760, partial [Desulfobacterales bacterium]